MPEFYAYRINLNHPKSKQGDLILELKNIGTKESEFRKIFEDLTSNKRKDFISWNNKFMIFHLSKRTDDIYIWELAKEQEYTVPIATETSIEERSDIRNPFIYLIFHISKQIVFIERNMSVFASPDSTTNRLEDFFNLQLLEPEITVSLEAIKSNKEFWAEVAEMDKVEDVRLEFDPPNWFGTSNEVDKLIDDAYKNSFFEKLKISLTNKTKGLTFTKEGFGAAIERLAAGTGKFFLRGIKNGETKTIVSEKRPFKQEIEDAKTEPSDELDKGFDDAHNLE